MPSASALAHTDGQFERKTELVAHNRNCSPILYRPFVEVLCAQRTCINVGMAARVGETSISQRTRLDVGIGRLLKRQTPPRPMFSIWPRTTGSAFWGFPSGATFRPCSSKLHGNRR